MANQSKLKAWLRYDGTGRVVTAGPILQANKPKVGNWRQMNADLCCNPSGSTTTTTTAVPATTSTTTTSGNLPTPYILAVGQNAETACGETQFETFYFAVAPGEGQVAYLDGALTIPYTFGYINRSGDLYYTNGQGVMQFINNCFFITTTTTTTVAPTSVYRVSQIAYSDAPTACANSAEIDNGFTLFAPGSEYQVGVQLYYDEFFSFEFTGTGWYPVMTQWPSGVTKYMYVIVGQIQSSGNC